MKKIDKVTSKIIAAFPKEADKDKGVTFLAMNSEARQFVIFSGTKVFQIVVRDISEFRKDVKNQKEF